MFIKTGDDGKILSIIKGKVEVSEEELNSFADLIEREDEEEANEKDGDN